ncbi:hypothetical protein K2173_010963 [Erythroxylum novogranatense]|uniref:K Homology domain-containing protein n=1 Tax=Erythroxylum novogranatense TaxID=1862640 RepID=A0AAV8T053_9ROSI|nr:hypothetical protein K2173_010963 [Erythroxylum novogranatense]
MDPPFTPRRSTTDPTQFRILCPSMKTGAVIGKGGSTVRHIQSLTGAKIRLLDDPHHPPCEERVILITNPNPQNPKSDDATSVVGNGGADGGGEEDGLGTVQKALVRVFEKVVKGDSEEELGEGFIVGIRILVAGNQMASLFGRGGQVVEKIRVDTGAQIRVLNREQVPLCALPGDEMIMVSGNFYAVKKSLLALSSYLQDCPREAGNSGIAKPSGLGYQGSSLPGQVDLPQRGYASGHSGDYHSRGYPPNMGPDNIGPRGRMNVEEEVVFKLLCQQEKVGSLIGKGGSVIRAIENETGAFIKIADPVPDSDERVVVISARENLEQRHSSAQDAVIRVQSRIAEIGYERGTAVVARLLVHSQLIGCLLGKGGQIISEMRQVTGTSICIFPKEHAAKYGLQNDEVVQVVGNLHSVQDALVQITGRLREKIFPIKPPFAGNTAPPYPPPFPDMHPPHFRPRPNPPSPGAYPSSVGTFHNIDRSRDHQPAFSYGMDRMGPNNPDRGPYPYGGERPGHGPPFENSPRSWNPQPFSNGNPRAPADPGSGMAVRNEPLGSGNQTANLPSKPVEIVIPQIFLGHVYGENSNNLSHIRQISGASVLIHDPKPGATDAVVVITGTSDQMRFAQSLVHAFILCGKTTT